MKLDYNFEVSGITCVVVKDKKKEKTEVYQRTSAFEWSHIVSPKNGNIKVKNIADKHVASRVRAMYNQDCKYRIWIHGNTINVEVMF